MPRVTVAAGVEFQALSFLTGKVTGLVNHVLTIKTVDGLKGVDLVAIVTSSRIAASTSVACHHVKLVNDPVFSTESSWLLDYPSCNVTMLAFLDGIPRLNAPKEGRFLPRHPVSTPAFWRLFSMWRQGEMRGDGFVEYPYKGGLGVPPDQHLYDVHLSRINYRQGKNLVLHGSLNRANAVCGMAYLLCTAILQGSRQNMVHYQTGNHTLDFEVASHRVPCYAVCNYALTDSWSLFAL